jgi:hypothetical protein
MSSHPQRRRRPPRRRPMAAQSVQLPVEAKIVVGVLALGAVMGTVVLVRHWIVKGAEARKAKKDAEDAAKNIVKEKEAWTEAGEKPSFPPTMYTQLADTIETAVSGPWYDPTDEDAIYGAFGQLINNQDYLALSGAYAVKGETLTAAIRGDMNAEEVGKVNAILAGKGIIYKF